MCDIQTAYSVEGMTCASCATKVKAAVEEVPGVTATNVDVGNGILTVSGHIDDARVRAAVEVAGYSISDVA